jgi:hypothetical protein
MMIDTTTQEATMVTITISDVGTWSKYELRGRMLRMIETGGCRDALKENHCDISSRMADAIIQQRVYEAWTMGYDGDPAESGLRVRISRA